MNDTTKRTPTEKKNSIISAVSTLLLMGLLVLLCAFIGLNPPDPPIPEEGVEVNLGNSDQGLGDVATPTNSENMRNPAMPTPSTGENVATQRNSSAPLNTSKDNTRASDTRVQPKQPTNTDAQPETRTNPNALFPGKKNTSNGGSQGVSNGTGNQGQAGGNPNSNRYDGVPGNGGSGYSLKGRSASALPEPIYTSNKEGKVIVKIWVDRMGNVTKVEAPQKGSTIAKSEFISQAESAARRAKFNADANATELQVGTITYVFRRNN